MLTEAQAREMRLDRVEFKSLEDAIKFGTENKLQIRSIYKYPDGVFKIVRFAKTQAAEKVGSFIEGEYIPYDVTDPRQVPVNRGITTLNRKVIDGEKVKKYFNDHPEINKYNIGPKVYRSRSFINDAVRYGNPPKLAWEAACDYLGLPHDYFDPDPEPVLEELEVEDVKESKDINYDYNNIHDDLMVLIASNKRLEALMLKLINIWEGNNNDDK